MNRRSFLKKSSLAAIAVSGLPKAIKAQQEYTPSIYKTKDSFEAKQTMYGISIYNNAVERNADAEPEEKIINLGIKYYETTDRLEATKSVDVKYIIEKTSKIKTEEDLWEVTAKFKEKIIGEYELPKDIRKQLTLRCKINEYINLLGKKDSVIVNLPYYASASEGGGDCFLTTACVHIKNLPDDCDELQTLRMLREQHMRNNTIGRALIHQYNTEGPAIVKAIDSYDNRKEIYEYMFQHMILPSVQLIKAGRNEEAIEYYTTFVAALKEKYA